MRSILTRVPGLLLSVTLALVPCAAWAGPSPKKVPQDKTSPQRVNLGKTQDTTTEVRWQSIPKTTKETGPWQIVGSTTRLDRSQPTPTTVRLQRIRTDLYAQRTTTYPLEAKEQRTKTTTTQTYELRTFTEQSTTSTVMVPVTREVGEWVTMTVDKPVTTPKESLETVTKTRIVTVPVYRIETSTKSVPMLTDCQGSRTVTEDQTQTVTKNRTESTSTQETVYYDGPTSLGGNVRVLNDGATFVITGINPGAGYELPAGGITVKTGQAASYQTAVGGRKQTISWFVVPQYNVGSQPIDQLLCTVSCTVDNGWKSTSSNLLYLTLKGKIKDVKTVTTTQEVPYTETVTVSATKSVPVPFALQLETLVNAPAERAGSQPSVGILWRHYHRAGSTCPFQPIRDSRELSAAPSSPLVGHAGERIAVLGDDEKAAFTLAYHHTDVLPQYRDDVTIETATASVHDHDETRGESYTTTELVTKQVSVQKVVSWKDKGPRYRYQHPHDATVQCDNTYQVGSRGDVVTHSREPVFAPVTIPVTTTEWATHSVVVQEPQTITSTVSVLVSAIPGQEVSVSYSPWVATGETRPLAEGTVTIATRSVEVAGEPWIQNLTPDIPIAIEPIKPQSATYTSDQNTGTKPQSLTGMALRLQLKANEAMASQARRTQGGGSIIQDLNKPRGNGSEQQSARSTNNGTTGNPPADQDSGSKQDQGQANSRRKNP